MNANQNHIEKSAKVIEFIKNHDHFLLSAHINADGDAVASVLAMSLLLDKMGKHNYCVFSDQKIDSRYNYIGNYDKIQHYHEGIQIGHETAIILDVPGTKRLGDISQILPDKSKIVKIDHHPVEDEFADVNFVDDTASSTTHLVFEIAEQAGVEIDIPMANAIYTGIIYDTGRLSFSNTTARDLYICSRMVEIGVKPAEVTNRIFFESSFEALKTIGKGLANLENHLDGMVNVIYLSMEELNKAEPGEIEELANYSVAIKGGEIGLFIREVKPGSHKVSFRSKNMVDVNQIAKVFNGGGHTRAAGCRIEGTKEEILPRILAEIKKNL